MKINKNKLIEVVSKYYNSVSLLEEYIDYINNKNLNVEDEEFVEVVKIALSDVLKEVFDLNEKYMSLVLNKACIGLLEYSYSYCLIFCKKYNLLDERFADFVYNNLECIMSIQSNDSIDLPKALELCNIKLLKDNFSVMSNVLIGDLNIITFNDINLQ